MAKHLVREVELWIHSGAITKVATKDRPGKITTPNGVVIATDVKHSFEVGAKLNMKGKTVYFFAVPLEYVVPQSVIAGLERDMSSLLAVNVSDRRKKLVKKTKGTQKLTPCGTGTTIQPSSPTTAYPPLAMKPLAKSSTYGVVRRNTMRNKTTSSLSRKVRHTLVTKGSSASTSKPRELVYYLINDYGHLILVRSATAIKPWAKIIANGDVKFGLSNHCNWIGTRRKPDQKDIERMRLCYAACGLDPNWEWK